MPDWRAAVPGFTEELQGGMINFVGDVGGGRAGVFWWEQDEKSAYLMLTAITWILTWSLRRRMPMVSREGKQYKACGNRVAYIKSDGGGVPIAFIGRNNAFHLGAVPAVGIIPDNLPIRLEMSPQQFPVRVGQFADGRNPKPAEPGKEALPTKKRSVTGSGHILRGISSGERVWVRLGFLKIRGHFCQKLIFRNPDIHCKAQLFMNPPAQRIRRQKRISQRDCVPLISIKASSILYCSTQGVYSRRISINAREQRL